MKTNNKSKKPGNNRQKFSIEEWQSLGDTVRGNGRDQHSKKCEACQGTGLKQITKDGEAYWCGCWKCENNISKYCIEE
ncbi:MAG: hypothetical protein PHH83_00590 [Patescibacteria group bacterium]|nr:hypothetical protein [Patescibacteria group bacterium]